MHVFIYCVKRVYIYIYNIPIVQQVKGSHEGGSMHQGLRPITADAMAHFLGGQGRAQGAVTTCSTSWQGETRRFPCSEHGIEQISLDSANQKNGKSRISL